MKNSAFIKLASEADSAYEDIYTVYGVSFVKGSYLQLLNTSGAKEYASNDSRLQHGVQYVASPQYAKRTEKKISLDIVIEASTRAQFISRYEAFTERISNGLFFLKIPSFFRVFKLVYSNIAVKQEYRNKWATFTLELKEPNPKDRIVIQ